ncbi:MAG: hypothetical protein WC454_10430, partial [Phycisphaerae bacterium]
RDHAGGGDDNGLSWEEFSDDVAEITSRAVSCSYSSSYIICKITGRDTKPVFLDLNWGLVRGGGLIIKWSERCQKL